jgi:RimJ/RimL family protein N-acetyltransferase
MTALPPDLMSELESERLFLRAYRPEDNALYFQMVRENWDHLYEFMPEKVLAMQSAEDAGAFIRWLNGEWEQGNLFLFGLWEKASGRYVGETYLANPDWHVPSIELGYFLVQTATGRGYATEAGRAALGFAFERLKVNRVDLQCRADNHASQRVAERLGFRQEGCQRLRQRKKDGSLVDRLWYGLLREEWEGRG